jgi:hypothetical protein
MSSSNDLKDKKSKTTSLTYYNSRLLSLGKRLPLDEIDNISKKLLDSHSLLIYDELKKVLCRKGINLSGDQRTRISNLLAKEKENKYLVADFLNQEISNDFKMSLYDPRRCSANQLKEKLKTVHICVDSPAVSKWLRKDALLGGTVILFSYIKNKPKIYTKFFMAKGKDKKPFLFYDTIEGGDVGRSSVESWRNSANQQFKQFMYNVSSSLWLADKLGLEKVVMGDRELEELAKRFGFQQEYPFSDSMPDMKRKMGLRGDSCGTHGPYVYQLHGQSHFWSIPLNVLSNHDEVVSRLDEICEFSKRKNNQAYELDAYFGIAEKFTEGKNNILYEKAKEARARNAVKLLQQR